MRSRGGIDDRDRISEVRIGGKERKQERKTSRGPWSDVDRCVDMDMDMDVYILGSPSRLMML